MRRRVAHTGFHEPSLVPLADMLTNTVGVMIFILIFTVLSAAAAFILKRLPMERKSDATALFVVCLGDQLFPMDEKLDKQFIEPLGVLNSYGNIDVWLKRFNKRQVEDEYFTVKGEGNVYYFDLFFSRSAQLSLRLLFTPREGKGETKDSLRLSGNRFRKILSEKSPTDFFVYFIVYPDSLDAFATARTLVTGMNFETGWTPRGATDLFYQSLTGQGQRPAPQ